jgi:peptidoglycan hydrolase CwlO-like protein
MGFSFKAVVEERNNLTKIIDKFQEELRACENDKKRIEETLKDLEYQFNKLQAIVKYFLPCNLTVVLS